ncbi:MAG: hypothetical protein LVQ96_05810 [Thermoplasmatales archaeon]|nr:hypothetical protein [Thermoplasmatales archaeon]MCW6170669.1 hypothetical protein [Thermoplasmatales archaeon]
MDDNDTRIVEVELKSSDIDYLESLSKGLNLSTKNYIRSILNDFIYLKKNHKMDKDLRTWVEDLYEEAMTATVELKQYKNRSRISLIFGRK